MTIQTQICMDGNLSKPVPWINMRGSGRCTNVCCDDTFSRSPSPELHRVCTFDCALWRKGKVKVRPGAY